MRRFPYLAMMLLAFASRASAQEEAAPKVRFQGRPLADCREFLLFETSLYQTPFAGHLSHAHKHSDDLYFSWESGAMANTSPRDAWGGTIYFGTDIGSMRLAILPRYRRWFSRSFAADASIGPFLIDTDPHAAERWPGFLTRGAVHFRDSIAFSTQLDMVRRNDVWEGRAMIGLQVGSYPAIPMAVMNLALTSWADDPVFSASY